MEVSSQLHSPPTSNPGKEPSIHWMEGWVDLRANLDAVVKRKIPTHAGT